MKQKKSKSLIAFFLLALVFFGCFLQEGCSDSETRQIILIVSESFRADRLGYNNYRFDITPNLDTLAASGTVFKNGFAHSSAPLLSLRAILTGRYLANDKSFPDMKIEKRHKPLAMILENSGFSTAAIMPEGNNQVGKNFSYGFSSFALAIPGNKESLSTELITEKAIEYITKNRNKSYFLLIYYDTPAYPYAPPAPYDRLYSANPPKITADNYAQDVKPDGETLRNLQRLYDGEIKYLDLQIGNILEALSEKQFSGKRIIIFTGLNGESFFEHGTSTNSKNLYEESLQVPIILTGNGVPSEQVETGNAQHLDIYPTILSFAGTTGDSKGVALLDIPEKQRFLLHELVTPEQKIFAVKKVKWKLLFDAYKKTEKLFNLELEPEETNDLISSFFKISDPELREKVKNNLKSLRRFLNAFLSPGKFEGEKRNEPVEKKSNRIRDELNYLN